MNGSVAGSCIFLFFWFAMFSTCSVGSGTVCWLNLWYMIVEVEHWHCTLSTLVLLKVVFSPTSHPTPCFSFLCFHPQHKYTLNTSAKGLFSQKHRTKRFRQFDDEQCGKRSTFSLLIMWTLLGCMVKIDFFNKLFSMWSFFFSNM